MRPIQFALFFILFSLCGIASAEQSGQAVNQLPVYSASQIRQLREKISILEEKLNLTIETYDDVYYLHPHKGVDPLAEIEAASTAILASNVKVISVSSGWEFELGGTASFASFARASEIEKFLASSVENVREIELLKKSLNKVGVSVFSEYEMSLDVAEYRRILEDISALVEAGKLANGQSIELQTARQRLPAQPRIEMGIKSVKLASSTSRRELFRWIEQNGEMLSKFSAAIETFSKSGIEVSEEFRSLPGIDASILFEVLTSSDVQKAVTDYKALGNDDGLEKIGVVEGPEAKITYSPMSDSLRLTTPGGTEALKTLVVDLKKFVSLGKKMQVTKTQFSPFSEISSIGIEAMLKKLSEEKSSK